jgi:hypothetical protein
MVNVQPELSTEDATNALQSAANSSREIDDK